MSSYVNPETEAEWDAWERRNPGVAHPARIRYREEKGRETRAQDWARGTQRFQKETVSFGERARRSRLGM